MCLVAALDVGCDRRWRFRSACRGFSCEKEAVIEVLGDVWGVGSGDGEMAYFGVRRRFV